jgi:sphingomyelin phosphodiesterase 2
MQVIRQHTNLVDAWAQSHPTSPLQARDPKEAVSAYGVTADSPLNTYSAGKPLEHYARQFMGKRLDYIFFRAPVGKTTHALRCVDSRVVFTDPVPGHDFSYSDHFGLEATLQITNNITDESIAETELTATEIDSVMQALTACYRFSTSRGKRELMAFVLCLIVVLGLIISSPWLPSSWANPLFMLLTVFVTWLGTTVLYEGFIYGNWERNALMNVIEELETHKQNLGTAMVEERNLDLDSW